MKKGSVSSTLLLIILVGGFIVATARFNLVNAETSVNGIITSDTTWTKANSPYRLESVGISSGATLTIEPGVTVILGFLQVNGTLRARGNSTEPIYVDGEGGLITFTQSSSDWDEQTGSGSIIENALSTESNSFGININGSPKINSNSINASIGIDGGSPIILSNVIAGVGDGGVIDINGGSPIISKNTLTKAIFYDSYGRPESFVDWGIDVKGADNVFISDNVIYGGVKVEAGTVTIQRNLITEHDRGLLIEGGMSIFIQNNTISNNNLVGIELRLKNSPSTALTISFNNFQDNNAVNNGRNLDLGSWTKSTAIDINANYNWWGTTNSSEIEGSIYDFNDDFILGKVNYTPFLTEPNSQAMPDPDAPIPTPNSRSIITETQLVVIAVLAVAGLLVAVVMLLRRRNISQKQPNLQAQ